METGDQEYKNELGTSWKNGPGIEDNLRSLGLGQLPILHYAKAIPPGDVCKAPVLHLKPGKSDFSTLKIQQKNPSGFSPCTLQPLEYCLLVLDRIPLAILNLDWFLIHGSEEHFCISSHLVSKILFHC